MSPAERWLAASGISRLLVDELRAGRLPKSADPITTEAICQAIGAAADYLEAGLAEPAPVAGVSTEERADALRLAREARCIANSQREQAIGDAMIRVLAALDAAERERDAALARVGALSEAEANARRAADIAETMRHDRVAAEERAAQAERERDEALARVVHLEAVAAEGLDVIAQYSPPLPRVEQALEDALVKAGLWDPENERMTPDGTALMARSGGAEIERPDAAG